MMVGNTGSTAPAAAPARMSASTTSSSASPTAKRGAGLWIGIGAVALAAIGGGAYLATHSAPSAPAPSAAITPEPPLSPAPAAAVAAAPTHFDALQQFDAVIAAQTAGWKVTAQPSKSSLRIGKDKLGFSVTSSQAGYLTVLLLGPDGSLIRLFPNDQAKDNRIQSGQTVKLPGSGWPLEAADPPGNEHFLAIVSAAPRDFSQLSTEHEDMFLKLPTGARADALMSGWNQSSPLLLGLPQSSCQGNDCIAYGATKFSVVVVR